MYQSIQRQTTIQSLRNSISRPPLPRSFFLIAVALACLGLGPAPKAFGVSPAPDGGYPNGNTAEGQNALFSLTSGSFNVAAGFQALYSNTTGNYNMAAGSHALFNNTAGSYNIASGYQALYSNNTGDYNMAAGFQALFTNTTGSSNVATGSQALVTNTTGSDNTASGFQALYSNTIGDHNMATGFQALFSNTTGNFNTANGTEALFFNTTGVDNTASGFQALSSNTTGSDNTANGLDALFHNTTGARNIALGKAAGLNLTTGDDNIHIGNQGMMSDSGTIRIGVQGTQTATFIAGISGATVAGGVGVIIDTNGHLGTVVSSERFKDEIKPMAKASEAILALKPVTFRYKKELDAKGIPQFGLVAEQVEKVNPDLVARDDQGKPYTVRYEAVNAMLLNEFLKEHRKVEEQEATIIRLQKGMERVI